MASKRPIVQRSVAQLPYGCTALRDNIKVRVAAEYPNGAIVKQPVSLSPGTMTSRRLPIVQAALATNAESAGLERDSEEPERTGTWSIVLPT